MKTVVASLFACAVLAHSPQLLAQAAAPEVAAPKAAPAVTVPPSDATVESQGAGAGKATGKATPKAAPKPAAPPGGAASASATEPAAPANSAAEPDNAAADSAQERAEANAGIGADTDNGATSAESTADEAPAPEKHDIGASRVQSELHKLEAERASYSRFLPWLTLGVGAAMTVGATAVGVGKVLSCDGPCSTSAWIGIAVATGTFIATIGTIWVVHANADVRELDSKHYQLEQELDRIRFSANLPNKSDLQRNQLLSMRWAFR